MVAAEVTQSTQGPRMAEIMIVDDFHETLCEC